MENTGELLKLIEKEMLRDISKIDVNDSEVTLDSLTEWYIETEKLIRALANLLPATMAQPINQLRYAGHHIIKISPMLGEELTEDVHSNIVEAYKHCKRAFFDSIDIYVYHFADVYKTKFAVLPKSKEVEVLEKEVEKHLHLHLKYRAEKNSRIEYYEEITNDLHEGLTLISRVDSLCREHGFYNSMLLSQEQLIIEKEQAIEERDILDNELNVKMIRQDKVITYWALAATALIVLSGLFQGYLTQKFVTPSSRNEIIITPMAPPKISNQSNSPRLPDNKIKTEEQKINGQKSTTN